MKKYFYSDGKEKYGPLSFEELEQKEVTSDTLVWFEGLDDWKPAQDLIEMKPILELKPPAIEINNNEKLELENKEEATQDDELVVRNQRVRNNRGMFSDPFSFKGRIRRKEYGISLIIVFISNIIIGGISGSSQSPVIGLAYIPLLWFFWAQGAKRCHDMGQSGWFQIIPFYPLWMIFANSRIGMNKYGLNPKG